MYAYIRGALAAKGKGYVALECGGVGYKVFVTERYLENARMGEEVLLHTHLIVREEELSLYGFPSEAEKEMFEKLIAVSGVGPKAGKAILSEMTVSEIASAIYSADSKAFSKVGGIGPKTAGRIVLELRDKVGAKEALSGAQGEAVGSTVVSDAIAALVSLGYGKSEAAVAVSDVSALADTAEELILLAIKRMG